MCISAYAESQDNTREAYALFTLYDFQSCQVDVLFTLRDSLSSGGESCGLWHLTRFCMSRCARLLHLVSKQPSVSKSNASNDTGNVWTQCVGWCFSSQTWAQCRNEPFSSFVCYNVVKKQKERRRVWVKEYMGMLFHILRQLPCLLSLVVGGQESKNQSAISPLG